MHGSEPSCNSDRSPLAAPLRFLMTWPRIWQASSPHSQQPTGALAGCTHHARHAVLCQPRATTASASRSPTCLQNPGDHGRAAQHPQLLHTRALQGPLGRLRGRPSLQRCMRYRESFRFLPSCTYSTPALLSPACHPAGHQGTALVRKAADQKQQPSASAQSDRKDNHSGRLAVLLHGTVESGLGS